MDISVWISAAEKARSGGRLTGEQNQIACCITRRAQGLSGKSVREIRQAIAGKPADLARAVFGSTIN